MSVYSVHDNVCFVEEYSLLLNLPEKWGYNTCKVLAEQMNEGIFEMPTSQFLLSNLFFSIALCHRLTFFPSSFYNLLKNALEYFHCTAFLPHFCQSTEFFEGWFSLIHLPHHGLQLRSVDTDSLSFIELTLLRHLQCCLATACIWMCCVRVKAICKGEIFLNN